MHNNLRHLGCWMHARRYFVEAEPSDLRAVEALAFIRTLYAVEREIQDEREKLCGQFADEDVVRLRQTRAGPILAKFSDWLEEHRDRRRRRVCLVRPSNIAGIRWLRSFVTSTTLGSPSTMEPPSEPSARSQLDDRTGYTWAATAG